VQTSLRDAHWAVFTSKQVAASTNPEVNFLIILLLLSDAPCPARHVYVRTRANDLLAFELAV
jgi:hypothetical protein